MLKGKAVACLIIICLLFFGCLAVNDGLAESTGAEEAHPLSAIPVLREMIEEMNRADEEMARMGFYALRSILYLEFVEAAEPYAPMDASHPPVSGNSVDLLLAARIEEAEFDGTSEFAAMALLTVNGRMVDFEMNGSQSVNGILTASLWSNRDYLLPIHAEHLPLSAGENEIMLVMTSCCPARELYLDAQYRACTFHADRSEKGSVIEPCPEERIDRVVTQKDAPELMSRPIVAAGEQLGFESDHRGHILIQTKPSPTLHFYIDNMSAGDRMGPRAGLMVLYVDGQPQPVWDGRMIGEVRLQDGDLLKAILLKTDYSSGERHSICWYYIETESAEEWKVCERLCITVEVK